MKFIIIATFCSLILDEELYMIKIWIRSLREKRVLIFDYRVLFLNKFPHQLLDHSGRNRRSIPRVLEHERPWVFPVRLKANLFRRPPCMNSCIEHGHSAGVSCQRIQSRLDLHRFDLIPWVGFLPGCERKEPHPLNSPLVSGWLVEKRRLSVEFGDPVIPIKRRLLQEHPSLIKPLLVLEPNSRNHKLGSCSLAINFRLPGYTEQPLITQSILDWKISIALEIFKWHLKTLKIQSIFQVLQKSNFNRIFKRNVLKIQSIFQSEISVSSYVSHSSAHHLAVDSWMAWRAIQPRGSFQPKRMFLDPWAIQPKMFCNSEGLSSPTCFWRPCMGYPAQKRAVQPKRMFIDPWAIQPKIFCKP